MRADAFECRGVTVVAGQQIVRQLLERRNAAGSDHGFDTVDELRPALEPVLAGERELGIGERGGRIAETKMLEFFLGLLAELLERRTSGQRRGGHRRSPFDYARVRTTG